MTRRNAANFLLIAALALMLAAQAASASIGVGVSPSKLVLKAEGGKTQEVSLLVFNSGDSNLEIALVAEGDIANFTQFEPASAAVEPEPTPHALPIKNGKSFTVRITPPALGETRKYSGSVSAVASPSKDSQFGGSVSVATEIELEASPPASPFAFITSTQVAIALAVVLLLAAGLWLRKKGYSLHLERK